MWRKLASLITLQRIDDSRVEQINGGQHGFSRNELTGDVELTNRLLFEASTERQFNPEVIGIDMLEAFITVRKTLMI